jgi:hypothetical protein
MHLLDGDVHGPSPLQVGRPAPKKPDGVPRTSN